MEDNYTPFYTSPGISSGGGIASPSSEIPSAAPSTGLGAPSLGLPAYNPALATNSLDLLSIADNVGKKSTSTYEYGKGLTALAMAAKMPTPVLDDLIHMVNVGKMDNLDAMNFVIGYKSKTSGISDSEKSLWEKMKEDAGLVVGLGSIGVAVWGALRSEKANERENRKNRAHELEVTQANNQASMERLEAQLGQGGGAVYTGKAQNIFH